MLGRIIGNYQVVSRIGAGGMGVVYLARHLTLGRPAAIKVLRPELSFNPEIVSRLFNEARAATAIRSPGIIEVFDFGFLDDRSAYIVMEYLEGESLGARIRRGRSGVPEALTILRGICRALQAAHDRGIVHRDIKPDNVFVVPDADLPGGERIKLLDFGIAKLLMDHDQVNQTRTGMVVGTPAYMAPEQCRVTGAVDARADLYALGCVAYELLCGQPPFLGDGPADVMARQLYFQPASLRSHRAGLPVEVDELVLRLLEKQPSARPATALEVIRALDRLAALPALPALPAQAGATGRGAPAPAQPTDDDAARYPRRFGRYFLLAGLAEGGMGSLYLAVGPEHGFERLLVIKTLRQHAASPAYMARFLTAARAILPVSHPNLMRAFDAGEVMGEAFLVMDFVEGRDLRTLWNRCARKQVAFPIAIAVFIVKELCRGLAHAHALPGIQLVHRDISPPSVVVAYDGEVLLEDFGLALSTIDAERIEPGVVYGKVAYLSPEQARCEWLDGRSDQYSLGIVLWELLTGRQLFPPSKDQTDDLMARTRNPQAMRPSRRAPRVPVELDDICLKALAPERRDRYADCGELANVLQRWLADHAPGTDAPRMAAFMRQLFGEDLLRERTERAELISRTRDLALSLPPDAELRRLVDASGTLVLDGHDAN
jgi:serine/threonine protein kinase